MVQGKNKTVKTAFTIVFSLAVAAFFMWWALRDLDFSTIGATFRRANYYWIFAAFLFGTFGYWLRAIRWNLLLEPMGYKISNSNAFWTISFGYLLNLTIPRSGEVARATALYGVEKVPVENSFGTIILERIVDLFFMGLILLITAIFKFDALQAFFRFIENSPSVNTVQPKQDGISWLLIFAVLLGLLFLFYLIFEKKIRKLKFTKRVTDFFIGIWSGMKTIATMKHKLKFVLYSTAIWFSYFMAAYLVCFALPETSGFGMIDGVFILAIGTLGMLVPASGGIGSYHLALKYGVMAMFLSLGKNPEAGAEVGLSYAFLSHTMQLVIMVLFGLVSIPILAKNRKF